MDGIRDIGCFGPRECNFGDNILVDMCMSILLDCDWLKVIVSEGCHFRIWIRTGSNLVDNLPTVSAGVDLMIIDLVGMWVMTKGDVENIWYCV